MVVVVVFVVVVVVVVSSNSSGGGHTIFFSFPLHSLLSFLIVISAGKIGNGKWLLGLVV